MTASKPDLTTCSEGGSACAVLRNTSSQAVAVQYRFYWYYGKWLERNA
ncbi:MAG: hypothetical protein ACR5LF_09375 [Symbiopectobacterium sp.]